VMTDAIDCGGQVLFISNGVLFISNGRVSTCTSACQSLSLSTGRQPSDAAAQRHGRRTRQYIRTTRREPLARGRGEASYLRDHGLRTRRESRTAREALESVAPQAEESNVALPRPRLFMSSGARDERHGTATHIDHHISSLCPLCHIVQENTTQHSHPERDGV
jgi:hypothetical protein